MQAMGVRYMDDCEFGHIQHTISFLFGWVCCLFE